MDFIEKVELIKTILKNNGYQDIANDIAEGQMSGGTLGEIFMIVCSKLLWIKQKNKVVYKVIELDAEMLLDYAAGIGYHIIAKNNSKYENGI